MPPLTTITILVYDLVKVNPTTHVLPALLHQAASPACHQKKADERLSLTKKTEPTTERQKPARPASRQQHCQTVLQNRNVNRPGQASCQPAIRRRKEGEFEAIVDKSLDIHRMTCEQTRSYAQARILYNFAPRAIQRLCTLYFARKRLILLKKDDLSTEKNTFTITTIFIYRSIVNRQKKRKSGDISKKHAKNAKKKANGNTRIHCQTVFQESPGCQGP